MAITFLLELIEREITKSSDPVLAGDYLCQLYEDLIDSNIVDKYEVDDIYSYIDNRIVAIYQYQGNTLTQPVLSHFQFMKNGHVFDLTNWVEYSHLHSRYRQWCRDCSLSSVSYNTFKKRLIIAGYGFKTIDKILHVKYDNTPTIRIDMKNITQSDPLPE